MSEETAIVAAVDDGVTITGSEVSPAARDVLAERARQITGEGFTAAGDDAQADGAMARAAGCYAIGPQFLLMHKIGDGKGNILDAPVSWPWAPDWWKPRSRREDLVRAGALIIAEIERLDRLEDGTAAPPQLAAPVAGNGWGE